jgi:hypothetical protein
MKTTKILIFPNQNENKGMPGSKSRLWNKKNKNSNTTCGKQKSNKILLQKINKTTLWQENVLKTNVEQTKGNGEILHLFTPIGHLVQRSFSKNFQLTCGPCSPMCELWMNWKAIKNELKINQKWIKNDLKVN